MQAPDVQDNSNPSSSSSSWRRVGRFDRHLVLLLLIALAIFVGMALAQPRTFLSANNITSMAFQVSEIGILTLAMMLSMLIGGIDLSVNAMANLSAIFAGLILTAAYPGGIVTDGGLWIAGAFAVALATGILCGFGNGLLIAYVRVPAILATLSTMTLYTGLAFGITKGTSISGFPDAVLTIGNGRVLGIPVPALILLGAMVVVWFVLKQTTYGFKVYMLGTNPLAALFSGINNRRVIVITHILVGLLSALTGIVALTRTNSANADYGVSYILMTILIAVLGGVAVTGGFGNVWGVGIALVALQFMSTGFNMLLVRHGGSNFFRDFAWGVLLLAVMTVTYLINSGRWRRLLPRRRQDPVPSSQRKRAA